MSEAADLLCCARTLSQVARTWKIRNPDVINPICRAPVAYKLFPLGCESGMCLEEEGQAFRYTMQGAQVLVDDDCICHVS